MLRLKEITKLYKASSNEVRALNNVSINFRKNEFVSILGPSGSGKTTLLNIIGGLEKYTSGDLIIAGKSTKDFKDRDWDFYRNERIGFIFQSYNLIPHQTVLANVELALTISGVNKNERIARAKEALDKVGLSDQYYKKPNQLSGGQCQRVAIARALVNNPEILLADEPTGALDTKTSEQIMDLIKEISRDRLVIMVTHNPDIASRYSSRIINLLDGEVVEDSNPFATEEEVKEVASLNEEEINKKSKAKMGLWTANKLSFKNLISKKGRTILVSIASSIGIIGVSTVLAVSFGVTDYVSSMQDDMLSSYPIEISEKSLDTSALLSGLSSSDKKAVADFDIKTQAGMQSMIEYLMDKYSDITKMATNDINKTLIEYIEQIPQKDVSAIYYNYGIDVTNNIFTNWVTSETEEKASKWMSLNGLTQRYISELKTVNGFSSYANYVGLFTNFMKEIPGDENYITSQYDLLGDSTFASNANEMMIVLSKDSTVTDLMLGQLGIYEHDEFINIGKRAIEIYKKGTKEDMSDWGLRQRLEDDPTFTIDDYNAAITKLDEQFPYRKFVNYTDLVGRTFYYLPHGDLWNYGKVSDDTSMEGSILFFDNEVIYNLRYDSTYAKAGFDMLTGDVIDIANPSNNRKVIYGREASKNRDPNTFFDDLPGRYGIFANWVGVTSLEDFAKNISNPMSVLSGEALSFNTIEKKVVIKNTSNPLMPVPVKTITSNVIIDARETSLINAYYYDDVVTQDIASNPQAVKMTISGVLRAKENTNFGSLSNGVYYSKAFAKQYMADALTSAIITDETHGYKNYFSSGEALQDVFGAYTKYSYVDYTDEENPVIDNSGYAFALNGDLSNSLGSMLSAFIGSSSYESTNRTYLRSLSGLKADISIDGTSLSVSFEDLPKEISIYPTDFASKDVVTKHLDRWNSDETLVIGGQDVKKSDRLELTYTDTVAMIITVINSLITIITSALVSFTSLSLVVSCFMIAVITYISVMERVKEIGVIRSLGGRKKDVSRLFTAENLMTGLASGVLGVTITYLLSVIINVIVNFFGAPSIAALPWWMALAMIALSVMLNVISGFIPSRNASKQDPVNALRSE